MAAYIKGIFKRYIFKSDSGYVIGLFKVKETNNNDLDDFIDHTITFTGYFHELTLDDTYLFNGSLVEHEKYGRQFQVDSYERVLPEEKDATIEFLSSGLFKGIGEKTAEKIVSYLGKGYSHAGHERCGSVPKIKRKIPGDRDYLFDGLCR